MATCRLISSNGRALKIPSDASRHRRSDGHLQVARWHCFSLGGLRSSRPAVRDHRGPAASPRCRSGVLRSALGVTGEQSVDPSAFWSFVVCDRRGYVCSWPRTAHSCSSSGPATGGGRPVPLSQYRHDVDLPHPTSPRCQRCWRRLFWQPSMRCGDQMTMSMR